MFLEAERLTETRKFTQTANDTQVDNAVLSAVEREYSLMDQEHARIRVEALASRDPDINGYVG